ncbi:MAG TPA: hypothetical protein VHG53_05280 [Candidatus Limnocylindria bacterium]|nr:hypothetical protein [Candidatus Limnocylindria bacterium]
MRRSIVLVTVIALTATACGSTAAPAPAPVASARHDVLYLDRSGPTAIVDADSGAERAFLPAGVAMADWSRYWAVQPGGDSTTIGAIDSGTGTAAESFTVNGRFALPTAYGAAPSGLSANGKWLVLAAAHPNVPAATSRFAVVDLIAGRLSRTVTATGDFSFDAISDDGRNVYLVEHLGPPTQYRVRVADPGGSGLSETPIVDVKVASPSMNGAYHSSVTDPSGQWQFGLYFNPTKGPFIHALNTTQLYAQCVLDLPDAGAGVRSMWSMALAPGGGHLYVVNGAAGVVADVGPTSLKVERANLHLLLATGATATTARTPVHAVALSADGSRLYVLGETGILVIQTADLSLKARYLQDAPLRSIALSPDGQRLYALGEDGMVSRLEASTGRPMATMSGNGAIGLIRVATR